MSAAQEHAAETFAADTKNHTAKILRDDGLYRHVRCEQPGQYSWNQWWEVVTWPHHLAIAGDMGCYVFSRVEDMFGFFRHGKGEQTINPGYWAQKIQASDYARGDGNGVRQYAPDAFRKAVLSDLELRLESCGDALTKGQKKELRESVDRNVLAYAEDGEHEVREAVEGYCDPLCAGGRRIEGWRQLDFQDFWEHDLTEYADRFLWCLHAIVWTVHRYDEMKGEKV